MGHSIHGNGTSICTLSAPCVYNEINGFQLVICRFRLKGGFKVSDSRIHDTIQRFLLMIFELIHSL